MSSYESIFWSLVHPFLVFCIIQLKNSEQEDVLVKGIWLMLHDLHFLILTCLHKIQSFSLGLSSEAISIDEIGLIAP